MCLCRCLTTVCYCNTYRVRICYFLKFGKIHSCYFNREGNSIDCTSICIGMIRTTGKSGCSCFALRCGRKYIHWNRVVYICSIKFIIRNVHQNVSHLLSWSLGRGRRWGCGWRCCRGRRRSRCFNKAFYCSIQRIFRGINSALGFFCRKSRFCCGKSSLDSFPGVCGVVSFL